MKRTLLIALFLILGNYYVKGQSSETANVNVSAQVIGSTQSAIEIITVNTLQLGNARSVNGQININPVSDLNAGFMIAVGNPEAEFRLNYLPDRILNQINGNGSLTFTYRISGNDEEEQATSEPLDLENRNLRFNEEGRFYIWIGGIIDLSNAPPGNYEGDFTIEIDYI
ncbi:hypothetical protein [Gracilimonas amylolytica]|uniref:hypothetical protein n=1 Tax=Gracilimonas amylolytica TaxID=1749045 RepID=UPI000CD7F271|nr:hypothetical protein [Gracilimonas amylolytica]